ncbi:unnamed protein product [Coffea canephora]|uniref:DH200=94 genomic scaffold, scaffold_810 n=1 Tax=Coffea canephora TaxID=49390 RepID=A0A068VGX7_COFCA|nr:unnamed protein product [Coffea canephora]
MLSGEAGNADSSAESSQEEKAKSSAESSQKARSRGRFIRHLSRARRISLSSQPPVPLPLEPASKLSPSIPETHHSQAAAIFIANNIDILQQILLYLPPKSLLRFQCVSKKWLSIISDPAFRRLHSWFYPTTVGTSSSASAATEALFVFPWTYKKTPQELNFISLSDGYVNPMAKMVSHLNNFFDNGAIVDFHSCNGLLALVFKLDDCDDHREFVVYNPTTCQHRLIPKFNGSKPNDPQLNDPHFNDPYYDPYFDDPHFHHFQITRRFEALNIVFDPSKSDHFKLVYIWRDDYHGDTWDRCGFAVYASETGIWRESMDTLEMDPPDLPTTYFGNGVLWNGDLHWLNDFKYMICFDLDKECLHRDMPPLPVEFSEWEFWYFGECNGCLYVIEVNNPFGLLFDVFEMERDYSKWVLKYHIDLAPLRILYPSMVVEFVDRADRRQCTFGPFGMLFLLEDEKEKKASLVTAFPDKVMLYKINDAVVTEVAEVGPVDFGYGWKSHLNQWKDIYRHMETLAYV